MARLVLTIEGAAGGPFAHAPSKAISSTDDPDLDTLMAWIAGAYGTAPSGAQRTPDEMLAAITGEIAADLFNRAGAWRRSRAAETAKAAVAHVTPRVT